MCIRFYCTDARAIARQRCRRGGITSEAGNDDGRGDNRRSYSDSDRGRDGIRGDESHCFANGRWNAVGCGFDTLSIALRVLPLALSQPRCERFCTLTASEWQGYHDSLLYSRPTTGDKSSAYRLVATNCHKTHWLRGCYWL